VVLRRTKFELDKAERRAHILEGYVIALDNIDEVIAIIKKSRTVNSARVNLMKRFKLSELQAHAILEMRLQRLTGLERKKIEEEYRELLKLIERLKAMLASKALRMQAVKEELLQLKEKYSDARRTQIIGKKAQKTSLKELLKEEEFVITLSYEKYIKRITFSEFEADQSIIKPSGPKDFVEYSLVSSNSHYLLFFTNKGTCHPLRTSFVPASTGEGTALGRLLNFEKDETVVNMIEIEKFDGDSFVMMATREGQVKRMLLSTLSKPKEGGLLAMNLKGEDAVVSVVLTSGNNDVILGTKQGMAIRFSEEDVRDMGLTAGGVRGMTLAPNDEVIAMIVLRKQKSSILTITSLGFGKRSELKEYSVIKRGGKGIITYKVSDKVGSMVSMLEVVDKDHIHFITKRGRVKRQRARAIKMMGRATQGMAVVAIAQKDQVAHAMFKPEENFKK